MKIIGGQMGLYRWGAIIGTGQESSGPVKVIILPAKLRAS